MRSLRILIYSMMFMLAAGSAVSRAQEPSVRFGIYDFTTTTASEFYVLAPTVLFGIDVWKRSQLDLELSTGLSFNRIRFNSHYHYLYMIPLMGTVYYNLPNPGANVWPSIGMGTGLLFKADQNKEYDKILYSVTYGFHATGRLNISLKKERLLTLEMTYNLLIPPVTEEVNLSGVILTVGLRFPSRHRDRE
jgi:hypothetical protein